MRYIDSKADTEYSLTKEDTDRLVEMYMEWLSFKKGQKWSCKSLDRYSSLDYKIYREGKLKFFLEVKFRRHFKGKYDTEKIPFRKVIKAREMFKKYGVKSYVLVKWADGLGVIDLEDYDDTEEMVARRDRGDKTDNYALYDVNMFTSLKDVYFMFNQTIF